MTGGRGLTPTEIDAGLQERYALHGHTIVYLEMWDTGSVLSCTECGLQVTMHIVNEHSGWRLSNRLLDQRCGGTDD